MSVLAGSKFRIDESAGAMNAPGNEGAPGTKVPQGRRCPRDEGVREMKVPVR